MSRTKASTRGGDASSKTTSAAPRGGQRDAYMLELGHRIRSLREARGLTQAQCAQRTGLGADVVSRLENGRYTSPGLRTLLRIAESLAVRPAELLPDLVLSGPTKNSRVRLNSMLAHVKDHELELIEELVAAVLRQKRR